MFERSSGILLPIFSLCSKYGIGTFGKEAYKFVDFLRSSGQKYWQVLPMGPTSYGDSPYSSFSVFAGNPYFIDLEVLVEEGFISASDIETIDFGSDDECIDYKKLFDNRYKVLRKAYENNEKIDLTFFMEKNPWIEDYALFMFLKYKNNQLPWYKWDEKFIGRDEDALKNAMHEHENEINFWIFLQYLFFKQYFELKKYANDSGISIIGDIPIYVSEDSVDVWSNSKLFLISENNLPTVVAGVPPDDYSDEGQLWGNPVYDWEYLKKTKYQWWINRIYFSFKMYDVVRIDHFRGFDEFWSIPYGSCNAVKGIWQKAYGKELFQNVKETLGDLNIIAEDLGIITDSVVRLKSDLGFPGMKVLQFAFDGNLRNPYLPKNYETNSVVYTGTHDNDTLAGWFEKLDDKTRQYVLEILNINQTNGINVANEENETNETNKINEINIKDTINKIINTLFDSRANLCIIPLQDYLLLGSEARINTPSTIGGNWCWRLKNFALTEELASRIKSLTNYSGR